MPHVIPHPDGELALALQEALVELGIGGPNPDREAIELDRLASAIRGLPVIQPNQRWLEHSKRRLLRRFDHQATARPAPRLRRISGARHAS